MTISKFFNTHPRNIRRIYLKTRVKLNTNFTRPHAITYAKGCIPVTRFSYARIWNAALIN